MARFIKHFLYNLCASNVTLRTAHPNLPISHEDEGRDAVECDHAQVSNGQIPQKIFLYIYLNSPNLTSCVLTFQSRLKERSTMARFIEHFLVNPHASNHLPT